MFDQEIAPVMPMRSIRSFVWDLADEGPDEVLPRLREDGFDGLNLALVFHGGRFYCPHNPKHSMIHAPDGVLYFQPLLSCYEHMRPPIHPEYGSGAFVARVAEIARECEIHLTGWVVLFNNMSLSLAHPECTCRNAFGDLLSGQLCPSNPAVRNYAQALVEDLAHRVGVGTIELEDFSFLSHRSWVGARWSCVEIGTNLGYLMSLCFCDECRKRAEESNIEVDDLRRRIERMIRAGLVGDLSDRRIGDEISDPYHPVSRFAGVRSEVITSLLDELNEATAGSGVCIQTILTEEPDQIWRWGIELNALRERVMKIALAVGRGPMSTAAFLERYTELLQMGRELSADIMLGDPEASGGLSLRQTMNTCLEAGVDRFIFSHYGLAPLDTLDGIGVIANR